MTSTLNGITKSLRVGIAASLITLAFGTYAFATTSDSSNRASGKIYMMDVTEDKTATREANGWKNLHGAFMVDNGDNNGYIEKISDGKYKINFRETIENHGPTTINSGFTLSPYLAPGIEFTSLNITPVNDLSAAYPARILKPDDFSYGPGIEKFKYDFAEVANGNNFIQLQPNQRLDYIASVEVKILPSAVSSDLSCNGYENSGYLIHNGNGAVIKGLTIMSYWWGFAGVNDSSRHTAITSKMCADLSAYIPAAISSSQETVVTTAAPSTNATNPAPTTPPTSAPVESPVRADSTSPLSTSHAPETPAAPVNGDTQLPTSALVNDLPNAADSPQPTDMVNEKVDSKNVKVQAGDQRLASSNTETPLSGYVHEPTQIKKTAASTSNMSPQKVSKISVSDSSNKDFDEKWLALVALGLLSAGITGYGIKQNTKKPNPISPLNMASIDDKSIERPRMSTVDANIEYIDVYSQFKAGQVTRELKIKQDNDRLSFTRRMLNTIFKHHTKEYEYIKK